MSVQGSGFGEPSFSVVGDRASGSPGLPPTPGGTGTGRSGSLVRPAKFGFILALTVLAIIALAAVFAPQIVAISGAPGPNVIDSASLTTDFGAPSGPSAAHWFGVDQLGRDVFSRTVYGARASLVVALPATALALLAGMFTGLVAGYRRGWLDAVLSRSIEAFLVFPYLLLAVGVAASCSGPEGCLGGTLRPGVPLVVFVIAIASWPWIARLTRNQTIVIAQSDYVAQARVSGLGTIRILVAEILPNLRESIPTFVVILLPQAILAEAALSFLGVGLPTTTSSWGQQISSGSASFPDAWWVMFFPGAALLATIFSIVVVGGWLRDRSGSGSEVIR